MSTTACPQREKLSAYAVGRLSDQDLETIAAHLNDCAACTAALATFDDSDDTFVAQLRDPTAGNPYVKEFECRAALARAKTMLDGPSCEKSLGEYQLLEEIGRGGMGRVYKALHTNLDRVVAVKVMPRGRAGDLHAITRFEREMKAVGRLVHPNIVQAYDAREIDGTPVLIMEYVDGLDLAEICRWTGPVPVAEACELARQTALALQCAHEHGLVHRDIKPSNVMLTPAGEVKLLDLGLARFCAESLADEEITGAGQAVGTTEYMAPEQASDSRTAGVRADVYSLGGTLYKLLTGRPPSRDSEGGEAFGKRLADVLGAALPADRFASEVPERLVAIVNRMRAKNPAARFATAAEAADALRPWCVGADLPALLRRAAEAKESRVWSKRPALPTGRPADVAQGAMPLLALHSWKPIAILVALLLLVVGGAVLLGIMVRTQKDGVPVTAQLVDAKDGNAILKMADGAQISVPLKQLNLADVQNVNDVIKSAETAGASAKAESAVSAAEKSQVAPPLSAAKPAGATAAQLKKLHYGWKKGQNYVYRVRIVGDRGNDTENRSGEVTYRIKSAQADEIQLVMTSNLKYEATANPRRSALLPARHVGFVSDVDRAKEVTIRIDARGQILDSSGRSPLPYLLGDLAELVVEPLPEAEQNTWTITADPGVAVVSLQYPFWRFSRPGFREGVPAVEKTVYTVQEASDKLITIAKHYEMTSAATLGGKPRIEAVGDGNLKFDVQRGVFGSLDYDIRVTIRDANKTEETPLHLTYRLLSEQDIAQAAEEAEQAKQEAQKTKQEKERPLTDKEVEDALAALTSDDVDRIVESAKLLADKRPQEPNPKVAKTLESVMLKGENVACRSEAARAMKNWSTAESVPGLIKALTNDRWPPVRSHAIEALCQYAPKQAIKLVAQQLINMQTRGAATKFLKVIGPDAEDAVLPYLEHKDAWVRAETCGILEALGTKKSLPALEKAALDDNWMVNRGARKALTSVKSREEVTSTK